ACQLCKRNCPADAVTIEEFHATIDQDKCTGCGACKEKCPKKVIV
ncbi:MAG: 4Fe-4S binding protein, partial [Lachnospiraceae bacterium]|nr:4Fe-4S binding protein [Lachnospiraceae bacterium]